MLDRSETGAVALEVLSTGLRIKGLLDVPGTKRVSDLLNEAGESLLLRDVRFGTMEGTLLETMPEFTVEKAGILAAVPWESAGYLAARRVARFGVSRPQQTETPVCVAVPPLLVRGLIHVAASIRQADLLRSMSRFFVLTDASIELNRLVLQESPTVILNRDFVLGVGPRDARRVESSEGQKVQSSL
jgi:hypothetical protein